MKQAKASDWKTEPLPVQRATITLDRNFTAQEIERIQTGLIPEQMEDKWFIYWREDRLFFHRSWTGFCVYMVKFTNTNGSYRMVEADVNRVSEQYRETSDKHDELMISYLIDALLLQKDSDFPCKEQDADKAAISKWSQVGRAMLGEHPKVNE